MTEDLREAERDPDSTPRACPACGAAVYRVHRRVPDRLIGLFRDVRRYRCAECPWEGLLPATAAVVGSHAIARTSSSGWRIGWALVLVPALALLAWVIVDAANRHHAVAVVATGGNVAVLEEQSGHP